MATLAGITRFPIKSLDGQSLKSAVVLPSGAIEHDRRWAMRDVLGNFVNGKRTAAVHRLRASYDQNLEKVDLRFEGEREVHTFDLRGDRAGLERWLSEALTIGVILIEDSAAGFPDDTEASGPTVISTATLTSVAEWFNLSIDEARLRFRANLEIDGVEPFWEDRLYAEPGRVVRFRIGPVELLGTNPCQRCAVPSRNSASGDAISGFAKTFASHREQSLPPWAVAARFDHYYRLAVNTRPSVVGRLQVGDEVAIVGVERAFKVRALDSSTRQQPRVEHEL